MSNTSNSRKSKILVVVLTVINLAFLVSVCFIWGSHPTGLPDQPPSKIDYATYLSLSLSAMQVVLAALAIALGLVAIFGYLFIRDRATDAAVKRAEEVAKEVAEAETRRHVFEKFAAYDQIIVSASATGGVDSESKASATIDLSQVSRGSGDWGAGDQHEP